MLTFPLGMTFTRSKLQKKGPRILTKRYLVDSAFYPRIANCPLPLQFKHPDFQANSKNNLDNIRRKAPTSRKAAANVEDQSSAIEELKAHIGQLEKHIHRQEAAYRELAKQHQTLVADMNHVHAALQDHARSIVGHDQALRSMGPTVHGLTQEFKQIKSGGGSSAPGVRFQGLSPDGHSPASDHNNRGQQMMHSNSINNDHGSGYNTSNNNTNNSPRTVDGSNNYDSQLNNDDPNNLNSMSNQNSNDLQVFSGYQVSQTNGSDSGVITPQQRPQPGRKRSQPSVPNWGMRAPRVLLVEDDPTCRRIGSKFLEYAECEVDLAVSFRKVGREWSSADVLDYRTMVSLPSTR